MEGLGALGFWLMVGMLLAAGTVTEGLKARDKERERQAMLRALLDKDSKSVTEILAYLRERDEAERKLQRALSGLDWQWPPGTRAVVMGILAFVGVVVVGYVAGLAALAAAHFGLLPGAESSRLPFIVMFGIWVAAPIIAGLVWRSSKRKHVAHPGA